MVFIGHLKKLNSLLIKDISIYEGVPAQNEVEIGFFEMCGVITNSSKFNLTICDFYGIVEMNKKLELEFLEKGSYMLKVKPYVKDNRICFLCNSFRKITIYEELAFNLEVKALEDL